MYTVTDMEESVGSHIYTVWGALTLVGDTCTCSYSPCIIMSIHICIIIILCNFHYIIKECSFDPILHYIFTYSYELF